MKTLYALAFVCLSLPAFASNLDLNHQPYEAAETACLHDLTDFDFLGENTAAITVPATPESEEVWAEIWLAPDSSPSSDPHAVGANDFVTEHTATIPAVESLEREDASAEIRSGSATPIASQPDASTSIVIWDDEWR